jgi:outer membrane protein assembly factor BamB
MCMISRISKCLAVSAAVAALGYGAWSLAPERLRQVRVESNAVAAEPAKTSEAGGGKTDHIMFGGTPDRNMVNLIDKDIPGTFKIEDAKWKATLGSRSYAGPIIANGKVFVGTNNENPRNDRDRGKPNDDDPKGAPIDKGVVMCFDEATGKFLWQAVHDKLESGIVNDWKHEGVCSTPAVEGGRVYYVSNRCTVVCAGTNGFDKAHNQGFQGEKRTDPTDADIIWEYDMIKELDVFPHNMSACSPLIVDDFIFIVTANGVDEGHINIPSPGAPSFIVLSKKSGKLLWKSSAPGRRIMHGQWSNPTYGVIKGVPQVIFPGGDGWLYAFKPDTGEELWKFDANPKDAKYELGGKGTKSDFIGTPVIYKGKIYIANGQDPEHSPGVGHLWCIDPAGKTGDLSPELVTDDSVDPPKTKPNPNSGLVWHYGGAEKRKHAKRDYAFARTMSTACIVDDVLYMGELDGYLQVFDAKTGKKYWQYDLKSSIWGSAYYVDGKIYIGNEDGDLFVFKHEKQPAAMDEVEEASKIEDEKEAGKKLAEVKKAVDKRYKLAKIDCGSPIRSTVAVANGTLYLMTEATLYAIGKK